ncbi:MAG: response regulator [Rhodospirillales bacterium]|nr:response regulator [Rhodospirillales bacterium]
MNAARNTLGEAVPASPPVILVVEDEVLVRSIVAAYLRGCGFDVIEAGGADEAIRVLQAEVRVDIVFSDVNMPGSMDGFGLAQWVRRERPWLKVILTSGAARTAKEAGDLCETGPIFAKPYDHAELEQHIRTLLAR